MAAVIRRRSFGAKRNGDLSRYKPIEQEAPIQPDRLAVARQVLPGVPRGVWLAAWSVAKRLDQFQVPAAASVQETRRAVELIYEDRAGKYVFREPFIEEVRSHRLPALVDPGSACSICRQPLNPAVLKLGYDSHYRCQYPTTCDCRTPWDDQPRAGGVHCIGCHSHFGSYEVFMKHEPFADGGCVSLHHKTGVDGQTLYGLFWVGEFRVWQRVPTGQHRR